MSTINTNQSISRDFAAQASSDFSGVKLEAQVKDGVTIQLKGKEALLEKAKLSFDSSIAKLTEQIADNPKISDKDKSNLIRSIMLARSDVIDTRDPLTGSETRSELNDRLKSLKTHMEKTLKGVEALVVMDSKTSNPALKLAWTKLVQNANISDLTSHGKALYIPALGSENGKFTFRGTTIKNIKDHVLATFDVEAQKILDKAKTNGRDVDARIYIAQERVNLEEGLVSKLSSQTMSNRFKVQISECKLHESLDKIRSGVEPQKPIAPIVTFNKAGKIIITQEAPIENLVFAGGGGRGLGNVKTIDAMTKAGVFKDVKNISGASAGAITAVGLAIGLESDKLKVFASNVQKSLDVSSAKLKPQAYPGITTTLPTDKFVRHLGLVNLLATGGGLVETIDRSSADAVKSFLVKNEFSTFLQGTNSELSHGDEKIQFTPEEHSRLKVLAKGYEEGKLRFHDTETLRNNPNLLKSETAITFADFALLRRLPGGDIFKNPTISVFNGTTHKGELLNADTAPNMPIALAVRISMSLPTVFRGVRADLSVYQKNASVFEAGNVDLNISDDDGDDGDIGVNRQNPDNTSVYYDGGLSNNLPVDAFFNVTDKAKAYKDLQISTNASLAKEGITEEEKEGILKDFDEKKQIILAEAVKDQQKTLSFIFDKGGETDTTINFHDPLQAFNYEGVSKVANSFGSKVTGEHAFKELREDENFQNSFVNNVVVVGHGELGVTDFDPNEKKMQLSDDIAHARAQEWIRNFSGQGISKEVERPEDAVDQMSNNEKLAFVINWRDAEFPKDEKQAELIRNVFNLCMNDLNEQNIPIPN